MKISSALVFLSLGAVSAFGLQPSPSATSTTRTRSPFGKPAKALVQPIGLDGQRLGGNEFVSSNFQLQQGEEVFSPEISLRISLGFV